MTDNINVFIYCEPRFATTIKQNMLPNRGILVVGSSNDVEEAKKSIVHARADIIILKVDTNYLSDVQNMADFLKGKSINYVAICDNVKEGFAWLKNGAVDMIVKSKSLEEADLRLFMNSLTLKVVNYKRTLQSESRTLKLKTEKKFNKIIAIGSSTGGTEAVFGILKAMPADAPPILVVQHMPPVFTKLYAERMHNNSSISVWEAQKGDVLRSGLALIAPGEFQMTIERKAGELRVNCFEGEKRNGHCPSADVLFESVAVIQGGAAIGVILTGMGNDGAEGLLKMHKQGSYTIGQNKESCVVYGMPKVAYDIGAVQKQVHLDDIPNIIKNLI